MNVNLCTLSEDYIRAAIEDSRLSKVDEEKKEQIRHDYTVADLLVEKIDSDLSELQEIYIKAVAGWWNRRILELNDEGKKYRVCLDIADNLSDYMSELQFKKFHESLIDEAIFEGWDL